MRDVIQVCVCERLLLRSLLHNFNPLWLNSIYIHAIFFRFLLYTHTKRKEERERECVYLNIYLKRVNKSACAVGCNSKLNPLEKLQNVHFSENDERERGGPESIDRKQNTIHRIIPERFCLF